jgi:hypothetical protein
MAVLVALPSNIYRYVWEASGWHQLPLVALTVCVSLLEVGPLELQRRIVDDAVKNPELLVRPNLKKKPPTRGSMRGAARE